MIRIAVPLATMFLSSKLDAKDETVIFVVRCVYGGVAALVLLLLLRIRSAIAASADGAKPVPAAAETDELPAVAEATTVQKYDDTAFRAWAQATLMGLVIPAALHMWMKTPQVLLMSVCMLPMNLYDAPLFKAYILGQALPRPFPKPKNALGDALKKALAPTDEAAAGGAPAAALGDAAGDGSAAAQAAALRKLREAREAAAAAGGGGDGLRKRA